MAESQSTAFSFEAASQPNNKSRLPDNVTSSQLDNLTAKNLQADWEDNLPIIRERKSETVKAPVQAGLAVDKIGIISQSCFFLVKKQAET